MEATSLAEIQKQLTTLQLAERFVDSVTLFALFDAGVFTALSTGPKTLENLYET